MRTNIIVRIGVCLSPLFGLACRWLARRSDSVTFARTWRIRGARVSFSRVRIGTQRRTAAHDGRSCNWKTQICTWRLNCCCPANNRTRLGLAQKQTSGEQITIRCHPLRGVVCNFQSFNNAARGCLSHLLKIHLIMAQLVQFQI